MNQNLELFKYTRLYLGKVNWNLMKKTSKAELAMFQKVPIDLNKSYFVYGSENILKKFRAFYLTRCIKSKPLYAQYSMIEYASVLSSDVKDEFGLNIDIELLFLYKHKHAYTIGKSDDWLNETILMKVADRNRDGLVTIILSEASMPVLENSGELTVINFAGITCAKDKKAALEDMSSGMGSSKSATFYD